MGTGVTTGGNRSTRRKPVMFGKVKLDNNLLTSDRGNFNQIIARSMNRTVVTVVRDTRTTTFTMRLTPPTTIHNIEYFNAE